LLKRLEVAGNPYIGVFSAANDRVLLVPRNLPKSVARQMGEALSADVVATSVMKSTVIGSLIAMNSNGVLATPFIEPDEMEAIGEAVYPLPHRLSAVGNNVLCNDRGALVHPGYDEDAVNLISDTLGVPVARGTVAGIRTVGAVAVATNRGVLCHPHTRPGEIEVLEKTLAVPAMITTANYGAAQVGACMVANSKGAVVGAPTTPIELGRIEEGLRLY